MNAFGRQDLLDLFWTQATIGAELASRAAETKTDEELQHLAKIHAVYDDAIASGNEQESGRLGHEFHRTINKGARSPRLAAILGSLSRQLPNSFYASIEGELSLASRYHAKILKALRQRDAKAAASLMFDHIEQGGQQLVKVLEERGHWDNAG